MKHNILFLLLCCILFGCTTRTNTNHNPDFDIITDYLGGNFNPMGPVDLVDVNSLREYTTTQKDKLLDAIADGSSVYFIYGPDWKTKAIDTNGNEVVLSRVERVIVVSNGKVLYDF